MKKDSIAFVLSLVVITAVVAVNRWDLPVTTWLCFVMAAVALISGLMWFARVTGLDGLL